MDVINLLFFILSFIYINEYNKLLKKFNFIYKFFFSQVSWIMDTLFDFQLLLEFIIEREYLIFSKSSKSYLYQW